VSETLFRNVEIDGVVTDVRVVAGDQVALDAVLASVAAHEETDA